MQNSKTLYQFLQSTQGSWRNAFYRYRFYFKETQHISLGSEYLNSAMSSDHFLGYEELGEFTAEATE